jgi:hypothetical protein
MDRYVEFFSLERSSRKDNPAVTALNLWLWLTAVPVSDTMLTAHIDPDAK